MFDQTSFCIIIFNPLQYFHNIFNCNMGYIQIRINMKRFVEFIFPAFFVENKNGAYLNALFEDDLIWESYAAPPWVLACKDASSTRHFILIAFVAGGILKHTL